MLSCLTSFAEVVIMDNPNGERVLANYASYSCTNSLFGVQAQQLVGPTDMVWNRAEGKVYIKNIVAGIAGGYVVATLSDDGEKAVVQLPQVVAVAVPEGTEDQYPIYVSVMNRNASADTPDFTPEADAAKNVAVYKVEEDGSLTLESPVTESVSTDAQGMIDFPDTYISTYIEAPEGVFNPEAGTPSSLIQKWYVLGTFAQSITPLPDDLVYNTLPESLVWDDMWRIVSATGDGRMCSVAIDGNDFYICRLADELPQAAIKGTLRDGKVTFPNKQFMGVAEKYGSNYLYFLGADYDFEYDEYFGNLIHYTINGEDVVLDWDAGKKTLTEPTDGKGFIVNGSLESIMLYKGYAKPVIATQSEADLNAEPLAPTVEAYIPGSGEFAGFVKITYRLTNVNQAILDIEALSYSIYVNGEKITFTPEQYGVADATTEIPYTYTDMVNGSIYSTSTGSMIDIYSDDIATIGAQAVYLAPDGKKYYSDVNTLQVASLTSIDADQQPVSTQYCNLQGSPLMNPAAGSIVIKVERYADGSMKACKQMF